VVFAMPVGVRRGARTNAPDAPLLDRSANDAERGRSPQATRAFAEVAGPPRGWMSGPTPSGGGTSWRTSTGEPPRPPVTSLTAPPTRPRSPAGPGATPEMLRRLWNG